MQITLDGKRALVTGASSGLGLHFAKTLAGSGAEVTLAALVMSRHRSMPISFRPTQVKP